MTDFNFDAIGLMRVMSSFADRKQTDQSSGLFDIPQLTNVQLYDIYKNSMIIQKIIKKYPMEAASMGYKIIDNSGNIIDDNNPLLLEAFKEASIFARIYGRCLLHIELDDTFNEQKTVRKGAKLIGYKTHLEGVLEGDFYEINNTRIYRDRVIEFIGLRLYEPTIGLKDKNYDSIIQPLYSSFMDYTEVTECAKYILKNVSYLSIGIDNLGNMSKSDEGRNMIFERLMSININRSVNRTMAYDKKTEMISFVSQTLSGIRDVIQELKDTFIANTEYPSEEIFEQAPTQKLGSGIQNQLISRYLWARRCRNWVHNNWLQQYEKFFNKTLDMSNKKVYIPFVVDLTDEERANIENIGAERTKKLVEAGVIDVEEARTGYLGSDYTLNIKLKDQPPDEQQSQQQEDSIPDNLFWDALAAVTEQDLDQIGREIAG